MWHVADCGECMVGNGKKFRGNVKYCSVPKFSWSSDPTHISTFCYLYTLQMVRCFLLTDYTRYFGAHVYHKALFWKEGGHVLWPCDSKRHSFDRSDFCYRQLVTKAKSDPSAVQQH